MIIPRLSRYVLGQVLSMYLVGLLLFVILQMTDVLTTTVGQAMRFQATPLQFAQALLAIFPEKLNRSLVLAVPFAILLAFSRLQKNSEIKAMVAAGVSPFSLVWPLILPFALVGMIAFWNVSSLIPHGWIRWDQTWYGILGSTPPIPHQENYSYTDKDQLFYAGRVTPMTGEKDAYLAYILVSSENRVITASSGYWINGKEWKLNSPWIIEKNKPPYQLDQLILPQNDRWVPQPIEPRKATNAELREALTQPLSPSLRRTYEYTLATRYADPFTPISFALAAGALGLLLRSRMAAMGVVVVFIALFYVLWWVLMPELARVGALSPFVAAWLPSIVYIVVGSVLAWRLR